MHMNSVPQHLLSEDRQDYERILDEALRSAPHNPELAAVGQRLNSEQLRTMALNATALISAAAATEYQHYVKVREDARRPPTVTPDVRDAGTGEPGATGAAGFAASMGEMAEAAGAGSRPSSPSWRRSWPGPPPRFSCSSASCCGRSIPRTSSPERC